jgi:5-amino-6-(5-phosphoribosylamino)uracil reductase
MSIDGYVDGVAVKRMPLSNGADLDRVDAVRASCDAILVGANTVRNDNPRLLVRSPERRLDRVARGLAPSPVKVTITTQGDLDPCGNFFSAGDTEKLVYCQTASLPIVCRRLRHVASVVDGGQPVSMRRICEDLFDRGVQRLMVEGGGSTHTQFLTADLADELDLVVAPFFVGDSRARRFVGDGDFPWNHQRRAQLVEVRQIGDVVLLRYALSCRFEREREQPRRSPNTDKPGPEL